MSTIDVGAIGQPVQQKRFWRPATVLAALVSMAIFMLVARHIVDAGYIRRDIAALQAGDAWKTGGWLSQVVLRVVALIPETQLQQTVLSLTAAVASGLALGVLYDRLRANGWVAAGAALVLLAVGLHAGGLYTLTASSRAIPLYLAFAVLIPAIRSMEDVGDVQSAMGLGLLMPLLLLASPITTPLILPFAIGAALADRDGRRDPRAFVAMLLVALLPTLIVAIGIVGFLAQSGFDLALALLPYVRAFSPLKWGDFWGSLAALGVFAPVLAVPVAYVFWPNLPERRHVFSALAILVLPLYLVLARTVLNTTMAAIVPPMALIACFVSWLAVVRLPRALRIMALVLLALSAALSWTQTSSWDDPEWKAALFNTPPALGNFALRPGV